MPRAAYSAFRPASTASIRSTSRSPMPVSLLSYRGEMKTISVVMSFEKR